MRARTHTVMAIALIAATVLFVIAYFAPMRRDRGPNGERFELVEPGMTREQVIELVGGPPGDYRTDRQRFSNAHHSITFLFAEDWISNDAWLQVAYDAEGRVERVSVRGVKDKDPPWWRRADR